MSRQKRQMPHLEANEEELRSWQEVVSWMDLKKLEITEPLFYAQFAEAIMLTEDKKEECEKNGKSYFFVEEVWWWNENFGKTGDYYCAKIL